MNRMLDLWRNDLMTPWRGSGPVRKYMDHFFEDAPAFLAEAQRTFMLWCDVIENKTSYLLKFDIPGLNKEQIKVDLHDGVLTVSGERREERKEEDKDHRRHVTEVSYGSFLRTITVPQAVESERVEARYENGVLNVTVPKSDVSRARQISIK